MKKLLSLFLLIMPMVVMGATVSGFVIDSSTTQGVDEIMVIMLRFEPNGWENVSFNGSSSSDGSFIIEGVEIGQYRVYTAYNDNYFTEYLSETIEVVADNQTIEDLEIYLEPIVSGRGSISGNINAEDLFLDNTSYFMTLKYMASPDWQISMGFQEIAEDLTYSYENLNIGHYKIGLLFYGQFSGEIWYDAVYSEEDAEILVINPDYPTIEGIDFEISFETLNQPYLNVENIIIDYGWDEILTNGEVFTVSYQIKNVGNLPSESSSFFAYSPYAEISMETVLEDLTLLPDEEVVLGPFEVTIDENIADEFNFHLFHSISDAFAHIGSPTYLTAYAPAIEIASHEITSNNGLLVFGNNTISLVLNNTGGAHVNYPVVSVSSDEEFIVIGQYDQTNYYWLEAEVGQLEFIFDFEFLDNSYDIEELQFEIDFSSLNTNMLQVLNFTLPTQQTTSNSEDIQPLNNISISNYPNPFNPETTISFYLPDDTDVSLEVFNLKGQLVKRLANASFTKGKHQVLWKGTNEQNQQVSSGTYMYKLQTGDSRLIKKMLLSK